MKRYLRALLVCTAVVSCPCWPSAVLAQDYGAGSSADPGGGNFSRAPVGATPRDQPDTPPGGGGKGEGADKPDALPPPPSLPGSHAQPTPVSPADKASADMEPNAALFDAINRGDSLAARDALSRGADPNARNVLGLTPIDLSVDLGRNDISFLLLSLRGSDSAPPTTKAVIAAPPTGTRSVATTVRPVAKPGTVVPPSRTVAGGAPAPASGFLGF